MIYVKLSFTQEWETLEKPRKKKEGEEEAGESLAKWNYWAEIEGHGRGL